MTGAALVLAAGCDAGPVTCPAPAVALYPIGVDPAAALAGGRAWDALGFDVELDDGTRPPQCPRHWAELGEVDCTISVVLELATAAELGPGVLGQAIPELRRAWVLDTIADLEVLELVVAHEVGHVVLDTGAHLPPGAGVMASSRPTRGVTPADRELACDAIGFCE